jgi:hypothetical protein
VSTLALILVPAVAFAGVVWLVLAIRQGGGVFGGRPWWAAPPVWIGVATAFLVLGALVAPRLFGFTFLFLPFLWMGRRRRGPQRRE